MQAPCDVKTELRCLYVDQAIDFSLEKGALVRRIVVTGRRDTASGRVEVVKGLGADAQILAVRFDNLKEGAPAKVVAQRSVANAASGAPSAPAGTSPSASASAAPVSRS